MIIPFHFTEVDSIIMLHSIIEVIMYYVPVERILCIIEVSIDYYVPELMIQCQCFFPEGALAC